MLTRSRALSRRLLAALPKWNVHHRPARSPYGRALLEAFEPRLLLSALPAPFHEADVGATPIAGSSDYNASADSCAITGSGNWIWYSGDQFHFVYQQLIGDMSVTVRIADAGVSNPSWIHPKVGLMIRQNLSSTSSNAAMVLTTAGDASFQYRQTGSYSSYSDSAGNFTGALYLKLTKAGDTISGYTSTDGSTWTFTGSQTLHFAGAYDIGMVVDSENSSVANTATFDHFAVTGTPLDDLPPGWSNADVGTGFTPGDAAYASGDEIYILDGGGQNLSGTADQFHFTYQTLTGDGSIVAHVSDALATDNDWAFAGIMIRDGLATDAAHATMVLANNGTVEFKKRVAEGVNSTDTYGPDSDRWLKLTRVGDTLTGYASSDGVTWTQVESYSIAMTGPVYIGLLADSGSATDLQTAAFDSVALTGVTPPAPPAPTGLAVTFPDSSYARLSWDAAGTGSTVAGYNVYMSTAGSAYSLVATLSDPTASGSDITGLSPDTDYGFEVRAADADNNESDSATTSGNSGDGIEAPVITGFSTPTFVTPTAMSVIVNWSQTLSAGILKTYVELRERGSSDDPTNWFSLDDVADPNTASSATLSDLSVGGYYDVRIRIITDTGDAYSAAAPLQLPLWDADPNIVDGPSVTPYPQPTESDPSPTITWANVNWTNSDEEDPPEHYLITNAQGTPFPNRWYGTPEIGTTGLLLGDGSYAWIGGSTGGYVTNQGDPSTAAPFTGLEPTSGDAPDASGVRDSSGKVTLTWTPVSGLQYEVLNLATGADVFGLTSGTFSYDTWFTDPVTGIYEDISAAENGSGGHTMNRTGYFAVAGYQTIDGTRVYTAVSALIDLAVAYTPKYFTATAVSDTSVRLEWDDTSYNETGFELQRSSDGGSTWTTINLPADQADYMDTGLTPGADYTYQLRAIRATPTLDSQWVSATPSQLPQITAHIVMAGLPPAQNTEPGGYILINADDDNGSTITDGIPAVRDYDATNLSTPDPDLIAITLSATGASTGDTLQLSESENGTGIINLWTTPYKTQLFDLNQSLDATQTTTVYAEGAQMSSASGDVVLTLDVTPATQPKVIKGAQLKAAVTPFLYTVEIVPSTNPTTHAQAHPDLDGSDLVSNIGGATDANGHLLPAVIISAAALANGAAGSLEIVQDVMITNSVAMSDNNTRVGAVMNTNDPFDRYNLVFNDPKTANTDQVWFLDEVNPADAPFADGSTSHFNLLGVTTTSDNDTPSIPVDALTNRLTGNDKMTVGIMQQYRDTAVWRFTDGTILPLGYNTWTVGYAGDLSIGGAGFTFNPNAANGITVGTFVLGATVPPALSGNTANQVSVTWRDDQHFAPL